MTLLIILQVWQIFDCGSKDITAPLVCLPPVSGTADCFFLQCLALSARGHRVIAAEAPPYWSVDDWCAGFRALLTALDLEKVHLFGAALGGFLAQKFAEFTRPCPRVASLVLCNTFTDTTVFKYMEQAQLFWVMPGPLLRNLVMGGLETSSADPAILRSVDFMGERLETLGQSVLASRLSVNCAPSYVQPHMVNDLPVTIIDVWDESALSQQVKEELYKSFPKAKMGHLKTGGNFPFLSRSDEVNLHIGVSDANRSATEKHLFPPLLQIHLRNFDKALA